MRTRTAKPTQAVSTTGVERGTDHQLSFALYGAANRMVRMHKPILDPLGLTFPQYLVLLELFAGAPRTVGDLGKKLGMDTGTITPLLKRLELSGKVTRTRDRLDERRVLVDLTAAAKELRRDLLKVNGRIQTACQLDESELADLRTKLEGLAWPAPTSKTR